MAPSDRGREIAFIVPGSIETRTGGYEYDRRIVAELHAREWRIDIIESVSDALQRQLPDEHIVIADGLALGAAAPDLEREAARLRLVPLIHMPGASGTDERAILQAARSIVVTGASAARTLQDLGVGRARITIVEPGTDPAPLSRGSEGGEEVRLLSVGNVSDGKGHDVLVRALASIAERNWRLTIAGSLDRDTAAAARLKEAIHQSGLEDRVALTGTLDAAQIATAYDQADIFVLATRHETYGMAVAEAIARGLPVVATRAGEIANIAGDGGLVVVPADVAAIAAALSSVLRDARLRAQLRQGAIRARAGLRTWARAGDEFAAAVERMVANG